MGRLKACKVDEIGGARRGADGSSKFAASRLDRFAELQVALTYTIAEFLAPSESEYKPTMSTTVDTHDAEDNCFGIQPFYTSLARSLS